MKIITTFLLLLLFGNQAVAQNNSSGEQNYTLKESIGASISEEILGSQVYYYNNHYTFASSLRLLKIDVNSEYYDVEFREANNKQMLFELIPRKKYSNISYFVGLINVEPHNSYAALCKTDKPYSKIRSIQRLLKEDCKIME